MNVLRGIILYPVLLIIALIHNAYVSFKDQPFMINRRRRKIRKMIAKRQLEGTGVCATWDQDEPPKIINISKNNKD